MILLISAWAATTEVSDRYRVRSALSVEAQPRGVTEALCGQNPALGIVVKNSSSPCKCPQDKDSHLESVEHGSEQVISS